MCRDILDEVHIVGEYTTKYSNIFDPVNLKIYLFLNHNFDKMVTLNLDDEIAQVHPGGEGVIEETSFFYKEVKISTLFEMPKVFEMPLIADFAIGVITVMAIGYSFLRRRRMQRVSY